MKRCIFLRSIYKEIAECFITESRQEENSKSLVIKKTTSSSYSIPYFKVSFSFLLFIYTRSETSFFYNFFFLTYESCLHMIKLGYFTRDFFFDLGHI